MQKASGWKHLNVCLNPSLSLVLLCLLLAVFKTKCKCNQTSHVSVGGVPVINAWSWSVKDFLNVHNVNHVHTLLFMKLYWWFQAIKQHHASQCFSWNFESVCHLSLSRSCVLWSVKRRIKRTVPLLRFILKLLRLDLSLTLRQLC